MLFSNEIPTLGDATTVGGNKVQTVFHLVVPMVASAVDANAFIAPAAYKVVSIREVHSVVGGTSAAIQVELLTGTTAPGSGANVGSSVSLTSTINTVQTQLITSANVLAAGDRVGLNYSGTLTGLVGIIEIGLVRL